MVYAEAAGQLRPYALASMRLAFLEGSDLGTLEPVLEAARRVGLDPAVLERALGEQQVKDALAREPTRRSRSASSGSPR